MRGSACLTTEALFLCGCQLALCWLPFISCQMAGPVLNPHGWLSCWSAVKLVTGSLIRLLDPPCCEQTSLNGIG